MTSASPRAAIAAMICAGGLVGCMAGGGHHAVGAPHARYPVSMSRTVRDARGQILKTTEQQVVGQYEESYTGWSFIWGLVSVGGEKDASESINGQVQQATGDAVVNFAVESRGCAASFLSILGWLPFVPTCHGMKLTGDIVRVKPEDKAVAPPEPSPSSAALARPGAKDRDRDTFPDDEDKCPDDAEVFNGTKDDDGCPDTGGKPLIVVNEKASPPSIVATKPMRVAVGKFALAQIDPPATAVARAIGQQLLLHLDWNVRVGFRPSQNTDAARADAAARTEAFVKVLRTFANNESAARPAEWDDVKNAKDAQRLGFGVLVEVKPGPAAGDKATGEKQ
jgi:hypothetical protein